VQKVKYKVQTSDGGFVEIEEKNSILITLGAVITALVALVLLVEGALVYTNDPGTGLSLFTGGIVAGIYAAVLSHLKHKADMKPDEALISSASGGSVRIWKASSVWISILLAFIYLGILISLGMLGYGLYTYKTAPVQADQFISIGIAGIIIGIIFARIFGFLRTKLEFKGERIIAFSSEDGHIELYKDRSVWLTLGFVVTLLGGIVFVIIPILSLAGVTVFSPEPLLNTAGHTSGVTHEYFLESHAWLSLIGLFFWGLLLLVNAAVLNFLRVRTQIRPANKI
jgi:MFS family permease